MIFFDDGGETFNHWGHFMGSNLIIRTMELGLFFFLIVHIVQGLILWRQNTLAIPIRYKVTKRRTGSSWYSRSMGLLGTLILMFLVLHLYHFWVPSRFGGMANIQVLETTTLHGYSDQEAHNLYKAMQVVFAQWWVVVIYVLGVTSLCWHLLHGFQSAFQTFGLNNKRYTPLIKNIGRVYSIVICLLFALMPVAMYFNWVK